MKKKLFIISAIIILLIAGYLFMSYFSSKLIKPKVIEAFGPGSSISQINVTISYIALKGEWLGAGAFRKPETKVMQKAVNLTPSSVLIATLIGGALAGVVGILLALPVTAMIKVFLTDIWYPNTIGKEQDPSQSDAPAAKAEK